MGSRAGKAIAGAAVTGLYTGLKFTGLAVRVASGLAASIGKDAEKALSRAEAAQGAAVPARVRHIQYQQSWVRFEDILVLRKSSRPTGLSGRSCRIIKGPRAANTISRRQDAYSSVFFCRCINCSILFASSAFFEKLLKTAWKSAEV